MMRAKRATANEPDGRLIALRPTSRPLSAKNPPTANPPSVSTFGASGDTGSLPNPPSAQVWLTSTRNASTSRIRSNPGERESRNSSRVSAWREVGAAMVVVSPATCYPGGELRTLPSDGRVDAVPGHHDRVGGQREQRGVDRVDDRLEVATVELGVAGPARKQRVATEQQGSALHLEADRARRVAGIVDGLESQLAHLDHFGVVDEHVVT